MKINFRYIKEKDLFEVQVVEPQLRSHFILKRYAEYGRRWVSSDGLLISSNVVTWSISSLLVSINSSNDLLWFISSEQKIPPVLR